MKKLIVFVAFLLLLTVTPLSVNAAVGEDLPGLTDEIIMTANDLFSGELCREITQADIDYQNAFQIYVGANLFDTEVERLEEIPHIFGQDGYIYELPIYVGDDTIIVNIARGRELNEEAEFTPEEKQSILDNVGKWQVTAFKYYEGERVDYLAELENIIGEAPEDVMLVGGLPYFRYAVALLPDVSGNISALVPLENAAKIEKSDLYRSAEKGVYDYQKVKEYVNELPAAGAMTMHGVVIAVILLGAVVIARCRRGKRDRKGE